jgi:hypothetical protein
MLSKVIYDKPPFYPYVGLFMKPQKRLRPMNSMKEIFQIPTIIYFPALLLSIAISAISFFVKPFSVGYLAGGIFAALVFAILIFMNIVIPATRASTLKRNGINGTAIVTKKEKRSRWISTLEPNNRITTSAFVITFEFTPEGSKSSLQLEAEVPRVTTSMQEGKTMKIVYARNNPRIVKLPGE